MGVHASPARAVGGELPRPALLRAPHRLQAHGTLSRAGGQLGLDALANRKARRRARAQPVRLHRRRNGGLCARGGRGVPCGRGQGHGALGQGEPRALRRARDQRALDDRRRAQVRAARKAPGPHIRRAAHGPALIRARAGRRGVEAGKRAVRAGGGMRRRAKRQAAVLPHQFVYHGPAAGRAVQHAGHDGGQALWRQRGRAGGSAAGHGGRRAALRRERALAER